jgi:hypothetical protein
VQWVFQPRFDIDACFDGDSGCHHYSRVDGDAFPNRDTGFGNPHLDDRGYGNRRGNSYAK